MGPLLFVNWRTVNVRFTALMWVIASVLALVILAHVLPATAPRPAPQRGAPPAKIASARETGQLIVGETRDRAR